MRAVIVWFAMTCGVAVAAKGQTRPLGITHVTVIDVEHGRRLRDHTVIIEGDRIATIGPSDQVRVPDGYGVVEARGRFVIPGLIDTHAHLTSRPNRALAADSVARRLSRVALAGVTTVLELSVDGFDSTVAARVPLRAGDSPVPRIRVGGTVDTSVVKAAVDGRQLDAAVIHDELRQAVGGGVTPADALRAVTFDAARKLGLQRRIGSVAPGQLADLLILEASPLDDIRNTARIEAIVIDGRFISSAERSRLLARVSAR